MSQNFLTIPITIQGMYLSEVTQVSAPSSDFSKLPWYDSKLNADQNFNQPFISDNCIRQPFEVPNTILNRGTHLHFIIPQYLGRKVPQSSELKNAGQFPAAPNRWLISKSDASGIIKQWYLESDYIHSEDYIPTNYACTIPFTVGKPYRYIGRLTPIPLGSQLPQKDTNNSYFSEIYQEEVFNQLQKQPHNTIQKKDVPKKPLTILGHGDLNFSSFYPNCNTVFGFHDPNGNLNDPTSYSVLGWHDSTNDDLLYQTITKYLANNQNTLTEEELKDQLKNNFGLELEEGSSSSISQAMPSVFYGEFIPDKKETAPDLTQAKIAVGQTGTEALSSFLGHKLSEGINQNREEAKSIIEDQLESVLMFSQLDENNVDVGAKFHEARHTKGFRPSHGGHKWTIQTQAMDHLPANSDSKAIPPLPSGIGNYLQSLNEAQKAFHKSSQEIITLQQQLYADWNKYMQARYPSSVEPNQFPDPDHIQYFIKNHCIRSIQQKVIETGSLTYDQENSSNPTATSDNPVDLAHQVQAKWEALEQVIQIENAKRKVSKEPLLVINRIEGPRFWEAKAPTILISGLPKEITSINNTISITQINQSTSTISEHVSSILSALKGTNTKKLSQQSWSPFLLDWQFNLDPVQLKQGNEMTNHSLQKNFNLSSTGPDFIAANTTHTNNPSIFSGTVILSSHTKNTKETAIKTFFKGLIRKEKINYTAGKTLEDFLSSTTWAEASACFESNAFIFPTAVTDTTPNTYHSLWKAYQALQGQQFLSQTLDGFYEACVQQNKVPQFPIKEPIGFTSDKAFTELVKATVGNNKGVAPEIAFEFNPIACGLVNPERLSLVDNFGISTSIDVKGYIPFSDNLTVNADNATPYLKPRLAQAARLNFNWIAANSSIHQAEIPTNDDTASSPICGWLMNNYLDNTIAIYDAQGKALGSINHEANWHTVPWNTGSANIEADIQNTHLYNVAQQIMASPTFMEDFMTATQNAQNNIAPQNALLHDIKSMLVGKPIAVVRASVGLELQGLPALDQSWSSLLQDLANCDATENWDYHQRYKQNWTDVQFPCRLGEHIQFNDGLIGYWTENNNGVLSNQFIAPQTTSSTIDDTQINEYKKGAFQDQPLVLNDPDLKMTLLMDPHGLLHATTGILPTKALSIPEKHYLPALKKLKIWFASSPLLQSKDLQKTTQINLPKIPEMQWQWWDPYDGTSTIENYKTNTHTSSEIKEGWIILENTSKN